MNVVSKNTLHIGNLAETIIKNIKEGILVLDTADRITFANDTVITFLGFETLDQIQGKYIQPFLSEKASEKSFYHTVVNLNDSHNGEETFYRADGTVMTCSYTAKYAEDTVSGVRYKLFLLRDVSAKKRSEEKLAEYTRRLEEKNRELDQFAYIVSHDLKAPLRAISNLSLWLQEDLGASLEEENKKNFEMLRGRVVRLESLINGILEYSKVGRTQITTERVDVCVLVNEVVEMLSPSKKFSIQIDKSLPALEAPKILLFQIFSNLIGNAIKYNDKAEGEVKIYCIEDGDYYEFTVEDNGPGIPTEFFEKIFAIFQTLQSRDKFESTGIGLTIVKRIVDEHGGEIRVESEIEKGSKFIFNWPKSIADKSNLSVA
ncbi:MAG TPA: ATP-binding protein [Ohtaekwangia sp.]|nr:ATP-binding protein [Ohtaekwangia sp.]